MRVLLLLWFVPLVLFWGWYGLSANDWNMGTLFFSREIHDKVFEVYGRVLGVDPALIPGMAAGACAFDSAIVLAIAAFRWRASWYPQLREQVAYAFSRYWHAGEQNDLTPAEPASGQARPAE